MNHNWKEFLLSMGAKDTEDGYLSFPVNAASQQASQNIPSGSMISDLSHFGLIKVTGEDKRDFLQGQLTNDVNSVTTEKSQLSSICNPKGRMLASFRLFERRDALYLHLPVERLDAIAKRINMFILRADVSIDSSPGLVSIGLTGNCVSKHLTTDLPARPNQSIEIDSLTVIRIASPIERYLVMGETEQIMALWEKTATQAHPTGQDDWLLQDIRDGIPTIYNETAEAFVPQMINMQLIDGVSFTKGCYTGQEVVARMQYLGKLKRRMYRAHVDTCMSPKAGDELFSPDSASGQGAGRIVDARSSPDGGFELLIVGEIGIAENHSLHLSHTDGSPEGDRLQIQNLPYPFEMAEESA